jgi:hypothetical protein
MSTEVIERLDRAEYDLVDALAGLPATNTNGTGGLRERALETLAKLRETKRALLARNPSILRKASAARRSAPAEPHWIGLPVDNLQASVLAKEARSRAAEEQRLAKRAGEETAQPAIDVLKRSLRQPTATGNAGLIGFLRHRAGR